MNQKPTSSLNIIDTLFIFDVLACVKEESGKHDPFDYAEALRILDALRQSEAGFREADATFAAAAVDPHSEQQGRFLHALRKLSIKVQEVDYRHAIVSNPRSRAGDRTERPVSSLAPELCYLLGLIASRNRPEAIIVSGSFDFYGKIISNC